MKTNYYSWCLAMLACAIAIATPDMAFAATNNGGAIGTVLCNVVEWFNGPVGAGIATLAIIVVGVGALLGKVSWGMAIIVGLGVALVFGASSIVDAISGGSFGQNCAAGSVTANN